MNTKDTPLKYAALGNISNLRTDDLLNVFSDALIDQARDGCEFVSSREQDYPDDGFRGPWLHVSDHGNATLYIRDADGRDVEQWSVV